MPTTDLLADNPFAHPSTLPYGLPPLDRIESRHIMPAVREGLAAQRAEWEAIATDPAPPTTENTLAELERSGQMLGRALTVHFSLSSSLSDGEVRARDAEIAPLLAEHTDALHLDPRIFARVHALHETREHVEDPETRRLLERIHLSFVRAGAALDEIGRARLRELNAELAGLVSQFRNLLVEGTNAAALHVTDRAALTGMSAEEQASAAGSADARGLDGWLLTLVLPSGQPLLSVLEVRDTRRRLLEASIGRCLGGDHDTRATISRIVALRAERAALLGFTDHASYAIADQTAGDAETVEATLAGMVGPAMANADAEALELTAAMHADGVEGPLQPWDWAFYAARVRRERFGIDEAALKPWFELDRVLDDGALHAASRLFGVRFIPRPDLPTYHPDVRTWEVIDEDGDGIGLCMVDPFARDSKRGGAWMTTLADQSRLLGGSPVVTVTLNIPKPADGSPALLTFDEVRTTFHEFGHALHGLFSDVTYPRFSGTSVPRDFVEFPSQVNEMWAFDPEVLARYARHHETDEPLDPALVAKVEQARMFGEGFATVEYLAATLLDLAWHRVRPGEDVPPEQVEAFEAAALHEAGIAHPAIPPRYRTSYFSHIFGGDYHARYYAYIWSEVLDAELVEWFGEEGGLTRDNGDRFREGLLAVGGSVDPLAAFEAVRGREATLEPLLRRRGLLPAEQPAGG